MLKGERYMGYVRVYKGYKGHQPASQPARRPGSQPAQPASQSARRGLLVPHRDEMLVLPIFFLTIKMKNARSSNLKRIEDVDLNEKIR